MSMTCVMVRRFDVRKTRKGDNYGALSVNLGRAGDFAQIEARIWGLDSAMSAGEPIPAAGDLIEVEYRAEEYQGRPQWIISQWRVVGGEAREAALGDFRPVERIDRLAYRQRLDGLIERVPEESACGQILREIFDRAEFREAFFQAPAARDHHQNYPGGLLEHTVNVTTLALALADAYGEPGRPGLTFNSGSIPIDRAVLAAAGLLHDIGKIQTYQFAPLPELTEANSWEGHLVISYAQVRAVAQPLLADPPDEHSADEINKLLHCILAHHGTLEFGSPVAPACAEAFLLAQADMTDARMADIAEAGAEALSLDPSTRWIGRQFHFPGGLFVGDWPTPDNPSKGIEA